MPWTPILAVPDAHEALRIAREIGERLRDPDRLALVRWAPAGVAESHPGLAVAFAQLDASLPGEGWDDAAHEQITRSVEALRGAPRVPTGLFSGLAGTAFAADFVGAERHEKLLSTLDGLIARRLETLVARLDSRQSGCAEQEIDAVSGLAGLGAYALTRGDETLLQPVVERLARLLSAEREVPAWRAPPELLDDDSRATYPAGRLSCGLAHGVPGPLALLALAKGAGAGGLDDAIRRSADWLLENPIADEWGVNWPYCVPVGGTPADDRPARAAWCYGAPGIARSLWLAGEALDDPRLRELAVAALEAAFRRPREELSLDGVTFCHGVAGVLQITLRMSADSGSERLREAASILTAELIERFEPDSLFGYRGLDPEDRPVDTPGLLEGAAGVMVVLLAAATAVPPRWDRIFLLA
jgi:class I lanthipeptide synthase